MSPDRYSNAFMPYVAAVNVHHSLSHDLAKGPMQEHRIERPGRLMHITVFYASSRSLLVVLRKFRPLKRTTPVGKWFRLSYDDLARVGILFWEWASLYQNEG